MHGVSEPKGGGGVSSFWSENKKVLGNISLFEAFAYPMPLTKVSSVLCHTVP